MMPKVKRCYHLDVGDDVIGVEGDLVISGGLVKQVTKIFLQRMLRIIDCENLRLVSQLVFNGRRANESEMTPLCPSILTNLIETLDSEEVLSSVLAAIGCSYKRIQENCNTALSKQSHLRIKTTPDLAYLGLAPQAAQLGFIFPSIFFYFLRANT